MQLSRSLPVLALLFLPILPTAASACAAAQEPGNFQTLPRGDRDGHSYAKPFFEGTTYNPAITAPAKLLGQPLGSRMARPAEIVRAFETWARESNRLELGQHGQTYEGRPLIHAIVSSPGNMARLQEIQKTNALLNDPRRISGSAAQDLLESTPAVAWMGYSIHGDETSGSDASLALAYHLIASSDEQVKQLLEDVVIVIDPQMNPDGRARIVSMVEQNSGYRVSLDHASSARGVWPYGRGNHFLFDMNRDWMAGVAPETRARWKVLRQWTPQLFVDAHEMSGLDTFLMYPQAAPFHPALPKRLAHWQRTFAAAHGKAFDKLGWGYYTREWADAWYPGYSDAWGSLNGAIGMLYEQGSNRGQPLMRRSGEVVPYREAVHGQVLASWSNLLTLQANRVAIRKDSFAHRQAQLKPERGEDAVVVLVPEREGRRVTNLVETLLAQGVEVYQEHDGFMGKSCQSDMGLSEASHHFDSGCFVIPLAQPQGALVRAMLEFDPRIDDETAADERSRLERGDSSRLYDVTAWDLARQNDVQAWFCTMEAPRGKACEPGKVATYSSAVTLFSRAIPADSKPYAYGVHGDDDRCLAFAASAMEHGLIVHVADEAFSPDLGGDVTSPMPRGSLLLRRHENPTSALVPQNQKAQATVDFDELVRQISTATGADAIPLAGGRAGSQDTADLGGGHFSMLARPRIALLTGSPLSQQDFGHAWQYFDEVLGVPVSLIAAEELGSTDLRRYNVLIIQSGSIGDILGSNKQGLQTWVRSGGTLIASGSAASALANKDLGLSSVVRRSSVLDDLEVYAEAVRRERTAGTVPFDSEKLWGDATSEKTVADEETEESEEDSKDGAGSDNALAHLDKDAKRADGLAQRFMPVGAILRAHSNRHSWLTYGTRSEMPVPFGGRSVLLSTGDVPVRISGMDDLRLGGLVWPEAKVRLADSAWLARHRLGYGQVILFASSPVFRGSWNGTARLLGNAAILGPGLGASQPSKW
ncbi:MAG: hypothetical protein GY930_17540 [bacterium]|nr:hypothetical protein [bacterium]